MDECDMFYNMSMLFLDCLHRPCSTPVDYTNESWGSQVILSYELRCCLWGQRPEPGVRFSM